jgi:hypothetical protein
MATRSFVDTLDIEFDDRLNALRHHAIAPGEDLRRGEPGAQEAIDPELRAAVNAGTILSFVAGLEPGEKSDVLYSTQLAHRAASAKHDRFDATAEWYRAYADVLGRLGWAGEAFAFEQRRSASGDLSMDRAALDAVLAIAGGNQLPVLVKTLEAVKKLGDGAAPLRLFELQALSGHSGNFQIGEVQKATNGALSLALGAFHFRAKNERRGVLFWKWGVEEVAFWTGAQKLTLNGDFYAKHRAAVIARLADANDYIAALEIA